MRGVHSLDINSPGGDVGSSPHARGPPCPAFPASWPDGIIPACAGSTLDNSSLICACKDHPRMRGVHFLDDGRRSRGIGSSPHARGPLDLTSVWFGTIGIIPACAGSTNHKKWLSLEKKDHPRMRGVHENVAAPVPPILGSSPHARGPLCRRRRPRYSNRIIPACAGSTRDVRSFWCFV